jgi:hypothetical protein
MNELKYQPKKPSWLRPIRMTWNRSSVLLLLLLFSGMYCLWNDISLNPNISSDGILGYFLLLTFAIIMIYRIYFTRANHLDPYRDLVSVGVDERYITLIKKGGQVFHFPVKLGSISHFDTESISIKIDGMQIVDIKYSSEVASIAKEFDRIISGVKNA